jgi:glycosyltransferase involved in cell wall biosynthesis
MHIMHVIDSLAIGGAERMLVDIANQSSKDNIDVSVCITRSDCTLASELRQDISWMALKRKQAGDINGFKDLASFVKRRNVDVFHVHGISSFSFLAVSKAIGLISSPIIFHDHNGSIEFKRSVPFWFRVWGKHYVDRYVGVYQKLAAWARAAGVPQAKIGVIENALDLSRIQTAAPLDIKQELKIPSHIPTGVVVGNIRPEKGIDVLLEAIAQSKHRGRSMFLLIGAARNAEYYQACRAQSAKLGLDASVVFLGERLDTLRIMRGVDFAVLPSRSESGPLALIEYMASGLPLIATRVGAVGRRVEEMGVPEFVAPGDPIALATALDCLLDLSPDERVRRSALGQQLALRSFDIRNCMSLWYDIYSSVLKTSCS